MNAPDKRLTGRIAPDRIGMMATPAPPAGAVERYKAIGDPTGVISDAMDELGIPPGVIGASVLKPTIPGTTIVGPALTLRNMLQRINPLEGAANAVNRMAEFEAHNLAIDPEKNRELILRMNALLNDLMAKEVGSDACQLLSKAMGPV